MNDTITRALQEDRERLARDLRSVVEDAEQLLKHAAAGTGQAYDEARVRLEQTLRGARGELAEFEQAVKERVMQAGMATDGYVRSHPWEAVGIGAGVGLLVGLLLARR